MAEMVASFPAARIRSGSGGLPVEVFLISQLGPGAGDRMYADATARQHAHERFVDAFDEPSAKLAGTDFARGESTALYTFAVGPQGHPFHRHAGHRVFTAVTGSGGALLRFAMVSDALLAENPRCFLDALHQIQLPPDCLFTVRFGDGAWHQFAPLSPGSPHPVFFALSCHTNELGGPLTDEERQRVISGECDLASLTELLPAPVQALLTQAAIDDARPPTVALSLDALPGSHKARLYRRVRSVTGRLRSGVSALFPASGFVSGRQPHVQSLAEPRAHSLLRTQWQDFDHQDTFVLRVRGHGFRSLRSSQLLGEVLDGFLRHRPRGVTALMQLRNALVKPLHLRTSPLGCPVSSLLSERCDQLFQGRFPVLGQQVENDDRLAQVLLGADDRHLVFRSCVGVQIIDDDCIEVSLGTRVRCRNAFGHIYIALIDGVHRRYVAPAMLRAAVENAAERSAALRATDGLFA